MGDHREGRSLGCSRTRDSSVPTGRARLSLTAGAALRGRWGSVGWGWGAPRAPLALEVRVLGLLPERREG